MPQYPAHTSVITPPTSRITCGCCARRPCVTVTFAFRSCSASMSPARMDSSYRRQSILFTISALTPCFDNAGVAAVAAKYRVEAARAEDGTAVPTAAASVRGIERSRIPDGTATVTRLTRKQFAKLADSVLAVGVLFARVVGAQVSRHAVHARDMDSSPTLRVFKRWRGRHGACRPTADWLPMRWYEPLSEEDRPVPGDWSRSG